MSATKTARNAPCPCGSGRKYKLCCAEARPARVRLDPVDDPRQRWGQERLEQEIAMLEVDEPHAINRLGVVIERRAAWHPRRAQRVLALFDAVLPAPQKRRPRKSRAAALRARNHPVQHSGHPTRQTRDAKRQSWFRPDKDEQEVREMARRWREIRNERKPRGEGDMSGPFGLATELAAQEIDRVLGGYGDPTIQAMLSTWLYGICGELIHRWDPNLTPAEIYSDERAAAVERDPLPSFATYRERAHLGA